MGEELIILDGSAFFYSDANGDVEAEGPTGFFFEDVRHLSTWNLTLDGQPIEPLTSRRVDYYSARVVGCPAEEANGLVVRRDRFVTDGFHEDIVVENLGDATRTVRVALEFASDFADVMEAQDADEKGAGRRWVDLGSRSATLQYERRGYNRGTVVTFSRTPQLTRRWAKFKLTLAPRESWEVCIDVTPLVEGQRRPSILRCNSFGADVPKMPKSVHQWLEEAPELETDTVALKRIYRQSLLDLAALRMRPTDELAWAFPGGGLPWFMTLFGRDSLIASYQALPFQPSLAEATLTALAGLQANEWDNFRDGEPGKILHELRRGTLARLGEVPHTPYYGSHDATLLFLIVLDEYERWTGDAGLVRRLEENARRAIAWMEGPADIDGDGWLEYLRRSGSDRALSSQGWKDSDDAIVFADGRRAEPPIALCEIQGYAYDARRRTARLAREIWDDQELAARLERDAASLRDRLDKAFWVKGRSHYALALDKDKRQVDSLTSNVGHLLWSGVLDERRARQTGRRLMHEDMFSGWGIRSMSAKDAGYNPLEYHRGTVWPHDTAIVAEGLRRYCLRDEAAKLALALLSAAERFGHQLPEVFAGFPRDEAEIPVEYPGALKPQAWAAGSPLLALRTILGLDIVDGRLRSHPNTPPEIAPFALRGLNVRGRKVDVEA